MKVNEWYEIELEDDYLEENLSGVIKVKYMSSPGRLLTEDNIDIYIDDLDEIKSIKRSTAPRVKLVDYAKTANPGDIIYARDGRNDTHCYIKAENDMFYTIIPKHPSTLPASYTVDPESQHVRP